MTRVANRAYEYEDERDEQETRADGGKEHPIVRGLVGRCIGVGRAVPGGGRERHVDGGRAVWADWEKKTGTAEAMPVERLDCLKEQPFLRPSLQEGASITLPFP